MEPLELRRPALSVPSPFKGRHFTDNILLCARRWYLRNALSDRDVEGFLQERRVVVDHTTIFARSSAYAPEMDKRCRLHLKATSDSYRGEETYILSATRDAKAAERFFRKAHQGSQPATLRVRMIVTEHAADPPVFEAFQQEGMRPATCLLRQFQDLE